MYISIYQPIYLSIYKQLLSVQGSDRGSRRQATRDLHHSVISLEINDTCCPAVVSDSASN